MTGRRSDAAAWLLRNRAVLVPAAVALAGLLAVRWALGAQALVTLIAGVVAVLVGAALMVDAVRRLRLARGREGPGVVGIRERRIAYMGPDHGGLVDMDDLVAVTLVPGACWRLQTDATLLAIPVTAQGAERLLDAFTALPGARLAEARAALESGRGAPVRVWQRAGCGDPAALDPGPARH